MTMAALGSLFQFIRNGMNVKQDKSGHGLPITRIETISEAVVDPTRVGYAGLTEEDAGSWLLEPGDILFSHINSVPHIGKCAVYRGHPSKLVHGMNLLCLRSDRTKLSPEFAKYILGSRQFRARLSNCVKKAVNQASVSIGDLQAIAVEVPSLPEQLRIAEVLDKADALRAKRRAALAELDTLTQSIFIDMFGDPATNAKGWKLRRLDETCDVGSSRRVFVEELVTSGVPFYRGTEVGLVGEGLAVKPSLFITKEHFEKLRAQSGVPKAGDLLLPSICPDGRIYLVNDDKPFYFKDARVLWLSVDRARINGVFLRHYLKHLFIANYSKIASGTTFAELKIVVLKSLGVPVVPLHLQQRFAAIVESIALQSGRCRAQFTDLKTSFASLQHRAFRGEL